jgi:hypothetical protein
MSMPGDFAEGLMSNDRGQRCSVGVSSLALRFGVVLYFAFVL